MLGAWAFLVPVSVGAAAVYCLLPDPDRTRIRWLGAALAAVALVSAGFIMIHAGPWSVETFLFMIFAFLAIVAAGILVTHHNPVYAALAFVIVVLSTCGLFLLLAAPFLMAATVIVYAGAIVVTFLFLIMLAQQAGLSGADRRSREPFFATVAGFVLLGTLLYLLGPGLGTVSSDMRPADGGPAEFPSGLAGENVAPLGLMLFRDYLVPVELAGMLLLVATVGAIALAMRRRGGEIP